jgi:hypothetical protein
MSRATAMMRELLPMVLLWIVSFVLFTEVPSLLGYELSYSSHPFLSALYYAAWLGAFLGMYPEFRERVQLSFGSRWYLLTGAVLLGATGFYTHIIPLITTPAEITAVVAAHPEAPFFSYGPLYVLPKTIEILFQQALVIESIYIVAAYTRRFIVTSLTFGLLFALIHIVSFIYDPSPITIAMVLVAGVAGALMPYVVLRVRNGVVYSFALHWLFYALLAFHFIATV